MFSVEFYSNRLLQWALGALIFCYFITFRFWIKYTDASQYAVDTLSYVCPAYFKTCEALYFLQPHPYGYSQALFYMILFAVLVWAVYLMSLKKWQEVQYVLMVPFLWHSFHIFFYTNNYSGNYEYYLVGYGIILLFLPHKEFFLKLYLVWMYLLSTVVKIHPSWIEGAYFTNLRLGLPLFPDWSIPLFTNLVIVMEMIGAWFLLSKHWLLQRLAIVFFAAFHFYSGIFVEYRYPATVLPMLLIMFGPWYRYTPVPLDKKSVIGWTFIFTLLAMQLIGPLIPGDQRLTMEGNKYGLFMFESNHQCIGQAVMYEEDEVVSTRTLTSRVSRNRCNPYQHWFYLNEVCEHIPEIERISFTFDHSINGDPFLRIVDTDNVCELEYKPFSHNQWIKTHADNPEVIGWPAKNFYGPR